MSISLEVKFRMVGPSLEIALIYGGLQENYWGSVGGKISFQGANAFSGVHGVGGVSTNVDQNVLSFWANIQKGSPILDGEVKIYLSPYADDVNVSIDDAYISLASGVEKISIPSPSAVINTSEYKLQPYHSESLYGATSFGGSPGNDVFVLSSDLIDHILPSDGIDTAVVEDVSGMFGLGQTYIPLTSSYGFTLSSDTGVFPINLTSSSIERLHFADKKIALDITPEGHAGQAMEFIGAVAPGLLNNTSVRGLIISLFDQGQTMESLSQLALDQNLLPTNSNAALANAVYHNVLGGTASTEMTDALVDYIEDHGRADFVATVAGLHINVDLVGLQQTGVEYLI